MAYLYICSLISIYAAPFRYAIFPLTCMPLTTLFKFPFEHLHLWEHLILFFSIFINLQKLSHNFHWLSYFFPSRSRNYLALHFSLYLSPNILVSIFSFHPLLLQGFTDVLVPWYLSCSVSLFDTQLKRYFLTSSNYMFFKVNNTISSFKWLIYNYISLA